MQFGQIRFQPAMLSATYAVAPDQFLTPLVQVGGGVGRADHLTNGGGGETSIAFMGAVGLEFAFTPSFTASTLATLYNSGHTAGSIGHQINGAVLSAGLSLWFGAPQPRYVMYSQPAALPMPAPAPAPAPAAPAPLPKPVPAPAAPQRRAPKTVTIRLDVRFETGKSIVREAFAGNLAEVGAFLQAHPATTAVIEGHSDSSGPETVNTRLSLRRAENVRLYLIGHFRIDGARLTAKGYGPSRPIADNGTEEGRALNRRVVAVLQAQE
jgi:OOP family OmpA-OmpF porin